MSAMLIILKAGIIGGIASGAASALTYSIKHHKLKKISFWVITIMLFAILKGLTQDTSTINNKPPYRHHTRQMLEDDLKRIIPYLQIISTESPANYKEFVDHVEKVVRSGSWSELQSGKISYMAMKMIDSAVNRQLPFASAHSIYDYMAVDYTANIKLLNTSTSLAIARNNPNIAPSEIGKAGSEIEHALGPKIYEAIIESKEKIIISGMIHLGNPATPEDRKEVLAIISEITPRIARDCNYPQEKVEAYFMDTTNSLSTEEAINIWVVFEKELLLLGKEKTAKVIKFIARNTQTI